MYQFIHSLALLAALLTLIVSLWQGWGIVPGLKRVLIAYLGFFFLGGVLAVVVRSACLFESPASEPDTKSGRAKSPEVGT